MRSSYPHITGVILAGGKSKRFGKDKSFALYRGVSFIERVLQVVQPLFPTLLLVTNTPEHYQSFPVRVVTDDEPDKGPLGGITTALRRTENEHFFVVACDMPVLNPTDIHTVIEQVGVCDAAIPVHEDKKEFLMALYSRGLHEPMADYLRAGNSSLKDFFQDRSNIQWVPIEGRSCFNVNTKRDLARLVMNHAL